MNDFEKRIRVKLGKKEDTLCTLAYEKFDEKTKIDTSKLGPGGVLGIDLGRKKGGFEHE